MSTMQLLPTRKIIMWIFGCIAACFLVVPMTTQAVSFVGDFAGPLLKGGGKDSGAYNIEGVDSDKTLQENLQTLFYPGEDGALWMFIRNIAVGLLLLFLVFAGMRFLLWAPESEEELANAKRNLLYIGYATVLIFAATRVLGSGGLGLESVEGIVADGANSGNSLVERLENNVILTILAFFKGAAFFVALVFLVYYGRQMMKAFDEAEKLKAARTGILNVFLALVFIKIIDYLYFIAQAQDFKSRAIELVVQISKFLGYVGGIMFVIAIMYTGFLMLTAKGDDDNIEKAKGMIKTIFTIVLIILLFMLVIYQVFNDLL